MHEDALRFAHQAALRRFEYIRILPSAVPLDGERHRPHTVARWADRSDPREMAFHDL